MINHEGNVKMKSFLSTSAHLRPNHSLSLSPAHLMLLLHWPCKLIPIEVHVLIKPQSNKYTVPSHAIYSRPTKLQSKHRLPSNSVSTKLCCNLICIQKRWMPPEYISCHVCIHMHALPHTWIYIATHLTLLRWLGRCFLLDLVCKARTRGLVLKTMGQSNIWHNFRVPRNIASSIIGVVTQRG